MTSDSFFFVYFSLTSDEINNVIRLSPQRRRRVLRIPHDSPRMFLPRLRKHVGPELPPERDKKRPYPSSFASTMTNIFLTIVLHRTIVGFLVTLQKEETTGETILPESWKTLREVRSVSAYLSSTPTTWLIHCYHKIIAHVVPINSVLNISKFY